MKRPLFAAVLCAALIAPLAAAAYAWAPVKELDLRILVHFYRHTGLAHDVSAALVNFGDLASLLAFGAIATALGLYFGRRREIVAALAVIVGANITTQLLKVVLEHVRYKGLEHGFEVPWADSFPSGHTTAAASIAVALLFVVPARHRFAAALTGLTITAAVAIAVVVLDWHYPSDVLGAFLVVGAWGFGALAVLRLRTVRERAVSAARTPPSGHLAVSTK